MSRRSRRRENRNKEREAKRQKLKIYDDAKEVFSYEHAYRAGFDVTKGVLWKKSVQKFLLTLLFKMFKARFDVFNNNNVLYGFIEFDIMERGKIRHIKSVHIFERFIQKILCKFSLFPKIQRSLIFDNSASQKGKGTTFAIERATKHLRQFYKKYSNNGYALLIDFSDYFGNLNHEVIKELVRHYFEDKIIIRLCDSFVDACGVKGLGLGAETSQIFAIAYINKIDHYIKEVARVKYYGRYMDDSYILSDSKEFLENLLKDLEEKYSQIGVIVNKKKTRIYNIKNGFTFLKTRFSLTDTGKVIRKPCRKSITIQRRKLKKMSRLFQKGILSFDDVRRSFDSWRGSMKRKNAYKTVMRMTQLFNKLFIKE